MSNKETFLLEKNTEYIEKSFFCILAGSDIWNVIKLPRCSAMTDFGCQTFNWCQTRKLSCWKKSWINWKSFFSNTAGILWWLLHDYLQIYMFFVCFMIIPKLLSDNPLALPEAALLTQSSFTDWVLVFLLNFWNALMHK